MVISYFINDITHDATDKKYSKPVFEKGAFSQDKSRFVTWNIAYEKSRRLQKAIDFNHSELTFCSTEYGVHKAFVKNFQGLRNRSVKGSSMKKLYVKR